MFGIYPKALYTQKELLSRSPTSLPTTASLPWQNLGLSEPAEMDQMDSMATENHSVTISLTDTV